MELGLSQVISNVPTTMLLVDKTVFTKALLYGVNIGGLGAPVASLANLIGLSVFKRYAPKTQYLPYVQVFTGVNVLVLVIFTLIFIWFISVKRYFRLSLF